MEAFKISQKADGKSAEALEFVRPADGTQPFFLVVLEDGSFDQWLIKDVVRGSVSKKEQAEFAAASDPDGLPVEVAAPSEAAAPEPRDTSHDVETDGTVDPNGPGVSRRARRKTDGVDLDAVIADNRSKGLANEETASGDEKKSS